MFRLTVRALAAACVAALGAGSAPAGDPDAAQKLGRYTPHADTKLAVPTAADADVDTEQVRHRGYGYGYRPNYYSGGYRPYYGSVSFGFSYYAPRYYAPPVYYTPSYYYAPSYYYVPPVVYPSSYYYGGYFGINGGTTSGVTATLALRPMAAPPAPPAQPGEGFRYDGGPSTPVPQPAPDGQPIAEPVQQPKVETLKISAVKAPPAAKPVNRYKAYGEK